MLLLIKCKVSLESHERAAPYTKERTSPDRCAEPSTGEPDAGAQQLRAAALAGARVTVLPRACVSRGQPALNMQHNVAI